jgi:hypothetical protein
VATIRGFAVNNLANAYGSWVTWTGLRRFKKTWESAKWNNVAANNAAGILVG